MQARFMIVHFSAALLWQLKLNLALKIGSLLCACSNGKYGESSSGLFINSLACFPRFFQLFPSGCCRGLLFIFKCEWEIAFIKTRWYAKQDILLCPWNFSISHFFCIHGILRQFKHIINHRLSKRYVFYPMEWNFTPWVKFKETGLIMISRYEVEYL